MRILLVESNEALANTLTAGLRACGFTIDWVNDGNEADNVLRTEPFELVILDPAIPGRNGLEVVSRLRQRGLTTPVLILADRDHVPDNIRALDAGADVCLLKDADVDEIAACIRALARRHAGRASSLVTHLDVVLDPATRNVSRGGRHISLTELEFALLHFMLTFKGQTISRTRLEQCLYGWQPRSGSNTVEVYICRLRKMLGRDFIRTIKGIGYFIPDGRD